MSAPAAAEEVKAPKPKSKKMLMIVGLAVLVLALGGGGAWYFMQKNAHQDEADGEDAPAAAAHAKAKVPPTFLPLENMVVNLADPGGERMAQIGITIELSDAHAADQVKLYLPSIRSGILLLISQRTSVNLLTPEGKQQLAEEIKQEVARPLGFGEDAHAEKPVKKGAGKGKKAAVAAEANPVQNVLFSSFIVQ